MPRVRKVRFKLDELQAEDFQSFCDMIRRSGDRDMIAMDRDDIARKLMFYGMNEMRQKAFEMQANLDREYEVDASAIAEVPAGETNNESNTRDIGRDTAEGIELSGATSPLHEGQADAPIDTGTV